MLAKRIIPCLDVKDGKVVKGVQFKGLKVVGEILDLACCYEAQGADELVFYELGASPSGASVCLSWIKKLAQHLSIPFTVAGGIKDLETAKAILHSGADKISINSPALAHPELIDLLSQNFGSQAVVVSMDSQWLGDDYYLYQYSGDEKKSKALRKKTLDWVVEVEKRGAGEIVLNCMQSDGMRQGYDLAQLKRVSSMTKLPLVASGGAGCMVDFFNVFQETRVSAVLAASVFHQGLVKIPALKAWLSSRGIEVRMD